jgi:hypothetical protein
VSTQQRTVGFDVAITYTGAQNLGSNTILQKRIPNFWRDRDVTSQAAKEADVECCVPDGEFLGSKSWICVFSCLIISSPYACYLCCQYPRAKRYEAALASEVTKAMGNAIFGLIREAAQMVSQREASITNQQGTVTLTQEQFSQLLAMRGVPPQGVGGPHSHQQVQYGGIQGPSPQPARAQGDSPGQPLLQQME